MQSKGPCSAQQDPLSLNHNATYQKLGNAYDTAKILSYQLKIPQNSILIGISNTGHPGTVPAVACLEPVPF